jgi:hypothetical protein
MLTRMASVTPPEYYSTYVPRGASAVPYARSNLGSLVVCATDGNLAYESGDLIILLSLERINVHQQLSTLSHAACMMYPKNG